MMFLLVAKYFYPRSPCGERRVPSSTVIVILRISIHALLAESDWWLRCWQLAARDISIHALLAESDGDVMGKALAEKVISIHALLAESDANWFDLWGWAEYFYPRSPCGERPERCRMLDLFIVFLSTLSLRRATSAPNNGRKGTAEFLSTLSLRRATRTASRLTK